MEYHNTESREPRGVEEAGCKTYSGAPTVSQTTGYDDDDETYNYLCSLCVCVWVRGEWRGEGAFNVTCVDLHIISVVYISICVCARASAICAWDLAAKWCNRLLTDYPTYMVVGSVPWTNVN